MPGPIYQQALFSDTYKVDQHLITGPYLHNKTIFDGRITANDFLHTI